MTQQKIRPYIKLLNPWEVLFEGFPHISDGKATVLCLVSKLSVYPGDHGEIVPQQIVVDVKSCTSRDRRLIDFVMRARGNADAIAFKMVGPDLVNEPDYVIYVQQPDEETEDR